MASTATIKAALDHVSSQADETIDVADVALVVPTYTPGLFPLSGVVEVPGLVETSAEGTAILNAVQDAGLLSGEYADYKVLALFTTPGYRFLMTGDGVAKPADLNGLKLRTPSPFGSELLALLGASGVAIPASRVYNEGGAMVSTVGTNPKVTEGGYKNLFRIIASDTQIGSNMAVYAAQVLKVKQVAVIDENGQEVAKGEAGEVVGRSGAMMTGYHKQPAKTAEAEWFDPQGQRFIRDTPVRPAMVRPR